MAISGDWWGIVGLLGTNKAWRGVWIVLWHVIDTRRLFWFAVIHKRIDHPSV